MAKRRWAAQVSIIARTKDGNGNWGFHTVKRGPKTKDCRFYLRFTDANGHQQRKGLLEGSTYEDALNEKDVQQSALTAALRGIVVPEAVQHNGKKPVQQAIDAYLKAKSAKKKKTVQKYTKDLEHFVESLPPRVQFVEDIDTGVLRHFQDITLKQNYTAKTLHNRFVTVAQMLKHAGSTVKVNYKEAPETEEKPPRAYSDAELHKLFSVMDAEEQVIFNFFLGTGCREQEVQHAEWSDIDWQHHTFTVQQKPQWGFTPKNHKPRPCPFGSKLLKMLKEWQKQADPDCKLIFPNSKCRPNGHFLRYLKATAKRAGLNCGNCVEKLRDTLTDRKPRTCKTAPVCERYMLHHFRKTYATRHHHNGTPLNDLRLWLGHKDLVTTQKYLAAADTQAAHVRAAADAVLSF
jgi:integrase/recombinase XerD